MVDQLAGEASLEVGDGRPPEPPAEERRERGALVEVAVEDVRPEGPGRAGGGDEQEEMVDSIQRRTGSWGPRGAPRLYVQKILPRRTRRFRWRASTPAL
jgi:hypothetical protein